MARGSDPPRLVDLIELVPSPLKPVFGKKLGIRVTHDKAYGAPPFGIYRSKEDNG
jgi:hypothetical protein